MTIVKADYLGALWDAKTQARFWQKVDRSDANGCWLWTGPVTPRGYGQFSILNRNYAAHRLALVKAKGDALDGLVCDHLCRTRSCVNPAHLEAVPNRENLIRGEGPSMLERRNKSVTHCPRGHAYTPENTRYGTKGSRSCRACAKIINREGYRRRNNVHPDSYRARQETRDA